MCTDFQHVVFVMDPNNQPTDWEKGLGPGHYAGFQERFNARTGIEWEWNFLSEQDEDTLEEDAVALEKEMWKGGHFGVGAKPHRD